MGMAFHHICSLAHVQKEQILQCACTGKRESGTIHRIEIYSVLCLNHGEFIILIREWMLWTNRVMLSVNHQTKIPNLARNSTFASCSC